VRYSNRLLLSYPVLVGILLGLLQTGLFFQMTFTLSSSFGTFLLVTLCWLLGSAIGITQNARLKYASGVFLMLALLAYSLCGVLLLMLPFDTTLWPLYGGLVLLMGLYPGVFFARMSAVFPARTLLTRENNGFIMGLVMGTLLFMLIGRVVLWIAPFALAGLLLWLGEPTSKRVDTQAVG
jgi:hypothetical protein